jgi:hypothetical protein
MMQIDWWRKGAGLGAAALYPDLGQPMALLATRRS